MSEKLASWFVYDFDNPLLFNSALFLGLFIVFYAVYILTRKHVYFRMTYVLLFSLFFYYKAGGMFFTLLILSCVINYFFSGLMYKTGSKAEKKIFLTFIIAINLLILLYYKYTDFLLDNFNTIFSSNFSLQQIVLPIGISFFTFQAISYSIDLYRREIKPAETLLDFSFYLCYFPQLVAGPIVRAKYFLPQIRQNISLTRENAAIALFMILSGLIKKAVISDYISLNFVDRIFDAPLSYSSIENLLAVYGYSLQIYCDFSGYSDMAIGLALLMGFRLPQNFNNPYRSASVGEFWRRWHISLSSWLRDYLYISMGGNRKGKIRTYINLFLTMLIGGLWHGAAWKFVAWGGFHGLALAVERYLKLLVKLPDGRKIRFVRILLVFHFTAFCWIFFRAGNFDEAFRMISQITHLSLNLFDWLSVIVAYKYVLLLIAAGYALHFFPQRQADKIKQLFYESSAAEKAVLTGFVFWIVYATASSGTQPFIYFQF
ncbi:MAG: MBOAT family protein [Prevotella sp.]|nr:MBOAT family protein [Prevotella sp.]